MIKLTRREREVFSLIGDGLAIRLIADRLCISVYTVKKHRISIIRKMKFLSTVQMTAYAMGLQRGVEMPAIAARKTFEPRLTAKENLVAGLICCGMTSKEIARNLTISPLTVRKHRENIMRKLGIHTFSALIELAFEQAEPATASEP